MIQFRQCDYLFNQLQQIFQETSKLFILNGTVIILKLNDFLKVIAQVWYLYVWYKWVESHNYAVVESKDSFDVFLG